MKSLMKEIFWGSIAKVKRKSDYLNVSLENLN